MSGDQEAAPKLPTVLFLCVENSCRSQMAEAFARQVGAGVIHAISAGTEASGIVNPKAIASMSRIGIDLTTHRSKMIAALGISRVDVAVSMGCGAACPALAAGAREDWGLPDPKHLDDAGFDAVRDEIGRKVRKLVARMASENPRHPA